MPPRRSGRAKKQREEPANEGPEGGGVVDATPIIFESGGKRGGLGVGSGAGPASDASERMERALKRAKAHGALGIIELSTGSSTSNTGLDRKRRRDAPAAPVDAGGSAGGSAGDGGGPGGRSAKCPTRSGHGAVVGGDDSKCPVRVERTASGGEELEEEEKQAPPRPVAPAGVAAAAAGAGAAAAAAAAAAGAAATMATATTATTIPATMQRRLKSVSFDDTNPRIKVRINCAGGGEEWGAGRAGRQAGRQCPFPFLPALFLYWGGPGL